MARTSQVCESFSTSASFYPSLISFVVVPVGASFHTSSHLSACLFVYGLQEWLLLSNLTILVKYNSLYNSLCNEVALKIICKSMFCTVQQDRLDTENSVVWISKRCGGWVGSGGVFFYLRNKFLCIKNCLLLDRKQSVIENSKDGEKFLKMV